MIVATVVLPPTTEVWVPETEVLPPTTEVVWTVVVTVLTADVDEADPDEDEWVVELPARTEDREERRELCALTAAAPARARTRVLICILEV